MPVQTKDPRWKTAVVGLSPFSSYEEALGQVQAEFVEGLGAGLFQYIKMLHGRLVHREPFSMIHGFQNWDYGTPYQQGDRWAVRVWNQSGGGGGWDALGVDDPNLLVVVDFSHTKSVAVTLRMGTKEIFSRDYSGGKATASNIGLDCGAFWEKLLTGSVDYGD